MQNTTSTIPLYHRYRTRRPLAILRARHRLMSPWQHRRTSLTTATTTTTTTITTGLILSVCRTLSGAKLSAIVAVGQKAGSTATAGPSGTASTRRTTGFVGTAINAGSRRLATRLTALQTPADTSQATSLGTHTDPTDLYQLLAGRVILWVRSQSPKYIS